MAGVTDEGKRVFGAFLQNNIDRAGFTSREEAARFIHERSGVRVPESKLTDLVRATWSTKFDFSHLMGIVDSELLKFADGTPVEYNDIMLILQGRLNPFTQETLGNGLEKPV